MPHILASFKAAIEKWIGHHHVLTGLLFVMVVTAVLTGVSMTLYITSGASGLDLSRPGIDKKAREAASKEDAPTFSASGNLTKKDMDTFMKLYTEQRDKLKRIGNFDDQALSDEALGIVAVPAQNE